MKILLRILLALAGVLVVVVVVVYADGASLPVDHTASVTGVVGAPAEKVFALIADPAAAPTWRPTVKSVTMLPPVVGTGGSGDQGKEDHWVEDLGHGQTMTFVATRSEAPTRREVLLDVPGAAYGGAWIYELSAGPDAGSTTLRITENGFIHPPMYRFVMRHVLGMTHNLDVYMDDMKAAAPKL